MIPDFNFKYYKEIPLFILVILFYSISEKIIQLIIDTLNYQNIEYYRFIPFTILLATLFSFINKYLHKIPWLWKQLIKVPLIRGTYEGKVVYNYLNQDAQKKCKFIIYQTPSKIKIDSYFWNSKNYVVGDELIKTDSESLVEDIKLKDNGLFELLFYYRNKGSSDGTIPQREGFNSLTYKKTEKTKKLEGYYFVKNGKTKGNGGKIKVDFKTKQLNY